MINVKAGDRVELSDDEHQLMDNGVYAIKNALAIYVKKNGVKLTESILGFENAILFILGHLLADFMVMVAVKKNLPLEDAKKHLMVSVGEEIDRLYGIEKNGEVI